MSLKIKTFTAEDSETLDHRVNKFLEENALDIDRCRISYKHKVLTSEYSSPSIFYIAHIEYSKEEITKEEQEAKQDFYHNYLNNKLKESNDAD